MDYHASRNQTSHIYDELSLRNPKCLELIKHILAEHVPDCEVRAFGSRVKWTTKDYSDLETFASIKRGFRGIEPAYSN